MPSTASIRRCRAVAGLLAFLLVFLPPPPGLAAADKRVALVIGNGAYRFTTPLTNPKSDAQAIGAALKELGFDVEVRTDVDKAGMDQVLRRFGDRLDGATAALFFYAGHGLQVNGVNYLVPTDAKLAKERDLGYEVVNIAMVLKEMEAEKRVNLVFLDACRDNPLGRNLTASGRSTVGRGLARVEASTGTLISYATKDGSIAEDGVGRNSPYTTALLKHLATPGLDVGLMLRKVREEVIATTGGRQVPWEYGSLLGEFHLKPRAVGPSPALTAPVTVAPPPLAGPADSTATELAFWESVKASTNPAAVQAYLNAFPKGVFAELARVRIDELKRAQVGVASSPSPPQPPERPLIEEFGRRILPHNWKRLRFGMTVDEVNEVLGRPYDTLRWEGLPIPGEYHDATDSIRYFLVNWQNSTHTLQDLNWVPKGQCVSGISYIVFFFKDRRLARLSFRFLNSDNYPKDAKWKPFCTDHTEIGRRLQDLCGPTCAWRDTEQGAFGNFVPGQERGGAIRVFTVKERTSWSRIHEVNGSVVLEVLGQNGPKLPGEAW